jgi:hypothetical protein
MDGDWREQLCDDAVGKWMTGPEEIDEFCDWLITEAVKRWETERNSSSNMSQVVSGISGSTLPLASEPRN